MQHESECDGIKTINKSGSLAVLVRRDHGSEVIAGACLAVVALKAALAANLDTRLRDFLDSMDDMNVSSLQGLQPGSVLWPSLHLPSCMWRESLATPPAAEWPCPGRSHRRGSAVFIVLHTASGQAACCSAPSPSR
jgi:hypothetical protein